MSNLVLTIIIAFVIIMIALVGLGISLLLTGRGRIQRGSCGRDPTKKREDSSCGTDQTCGLCEPDADKKD